MGNDKYDDEKLAELKNNCVDFIDVLLKKYDNPLAIACSMYQVAMSIYKTILSEEEYNYICELIYETRNEVASFKTPQNTGNYLN